MKLEMRKLADYEIPPQFLEIPEPPKQLYLVGKMPKEGNKLLAIVGSRKFSSYGKEVCEKLIAGLKGQPVTIVSGLALGIDSIAHRAALQNNLQTIAFPGSGLDESVLYPTSHLNLAKEIVENGGGLLSEFDQKFRATPYSFPQRNRLIAGISHATLIIEAEKKSGTLITSRLATDYNKDVLAVPGSIFSKTSEGPHMLIRLGATPITCVNDLLEALHLEPEQQALDFVDCNEDELLILKLLDTPISRDELLEQAEISIQTLNSILMMLEIKGFIQESQGLISRKS
ncbi:MAG: DNA-processing protein DprA [bacterium]